MFKFIIVNYLFFNIILNNNIKIMANIKEEILNLKNELNELKIENKILNQNIKEQSIEIEKLKSIHQNDITKIIKEMENKEKIYQTKIEEMKIEIKTLKENINQKITNKIIDNAAPMNNISLASLSSNNEHFLENIEKEKYITSISFYISDSINLSVNQLHYYGFEHVVEDDIRKGAGGTYCVLGYKYEKNKPFITNIIGCVSDKEEPFVIYENGIKYIAIKVPFQNNNIHKGNGGNYLCLYFTNDSKAGKPIKNLKFKSTKDILNDVNIVKYCMIETKYNKPFQPLDCNRGRGKIYKWPTPQNYIFIERD